MKIGFRDTDKQVMTMVIDGVEYRFTDLLLHEKQPVCKVLLDGGGCLLLYFSATDGKCFIIEDYKEEILR